MYLRHRTNRNALSDNGMIDVASKNATILHIRIFANKDSTTIISANSPVRQPQAGQDEAPKSNHPLDAKNALHSDSCRLSGWLRTILMRLFRLGRTQSRSNRVPRMLPLVKQSAPPVGEVAFGGDGVKDGHGICRGYHRAISASSSYCMFTLSKCNRSSNFMRIKEW